MNLVFKILRFRFQQTGRMLQSAGLGVLLLLLFLSMGMLFTAFDQLRSLPPLYALFAGIFILLAIDLNRKDKAFLRSIIDKRWKLFILYCFEYGLILSPLLFFQVYMNNWDYAVIMDFSAIVIAAISPLLRKNYHRSKKRSLSFIPLYLFEIKFQLEKNPFVLLGVYIFSFLSFIHIAFFIVPMALFCLMIPEAFRGFEPPEMIHWKSTFVLSRIWQNIRFCLLLLLPPFLLALQFNIELWMLIVYSLLAFVLILFLSISFKYANFNFFYADVGTSNVIALMVLFVFIPGGIIVTLCFGLYKYFQAEKKMREHYAEIG